jgi:hypothetical protein
MIKQIVFTVILFGSLPALSKTCIVRYEANTIFTYKVPNFDIDPIKQELANVGCEVSKKVDVKNASHELIVTKYDQTYGCYLGTGIRQKYFAQLSRLSLDADGEVVRTILAKTYGSDCTFSNGSVRAIRKMANIINRTRLMDQYLKEEGHQEID